MSTVVKYINPFFIIFGVTLGYSVAGGDSARGFALRFGFVLGFYAAFDYFCRRFFRRRGEPARLSDLFDRRSLQKPGDPQTARADAADSIAGRKGGVTHE